jgi:hypothetical protein
MSNQGNGEDGEVIVTHHRVEKIVHHNEDSSRSFSDIETT